MSEVEVAQAKFDRDSQELATFVEDTLKGRNYKLTRSDNRTVVLLFNGRKYEIRVVVFCGGSYLTFQAGLPVLLPAERLPAALQRFNKRTRSMPVGGFEVEPDGGKVWVKIGIPVPPLPTAELLVTLLTLVVSSIDDATDEIDQIVS